MNRTKKKKRKKDKHRVIGSGELNGDTRVESVSKRIIERGW